MMIQKVITGGQSGTERAALDSAARMGIAHQGWILASSAPEQRPAMTRYRLCLSNADSLEALFEVCVIASDGTLLISRGERTAGGRQAIRMALKHEKQILHAPLNLYRADDAASLIAAWIQMQHVHVLYITGPTEAEDATIYHDALAVLTLALSEVRIHASSQTLTQRPAEGNPAHTISTAANAIIDDLTLRERTVILGMDRRQIQQIGHHAVVEILRRTISRRTKRGGPLKGQHLSVLDAYPTAAQILDAVWCRLNHLHPNRRTSRDGPSH